jgi:DNA-binding LytR/AlgR family response regulator
VVARRRRDLVFLEAVDVWGFQAEEGLRFVHCAQGRYDVDLSLAEIQASVLGHLFRRVHRCWLVSLRHVKAFDQFSGNTWLRLGASPGEQAGIRVPVSTCCTREVRKALLAGTVGVRRREPTLKT